jgi:hypothetical protein
MCKNIGANKMLIDFRLRYIKIIFVLVITISLISGCVAGVTTEALEPAVTQTPIPPSATTIPSTNTPQPPTATPTATITRTDVPPTQTEALEPTTTQTLGPTPLITEISPSGGVSFVDSGQSLGDMRSNAVALGDLDGDGDLDVLIANQEMSKLWLNNGAAIFTDSGQNLDSIAALELGDLDLDGDLDVFSVGGSVKIWFNDGAGVFTETKVDDQECSGVALGDIDTDGDMDAFITRIAHPNQVWFNDGQGAFVKSDQLIGGNQDIYDFSLGVLLADLAGDGDLDAFEVNYNGYHRVWLNDGAGIFTKSDQSLNVREHSHGIALGDLDADGDLDAFVSVTGTMAFRVWFNDGEGNFIDSGQQFPSSNAQAVALGDLDGDGDLDAFMAHSGTSDAGYGNTVWLNDSLGNFYDSGLRLRHEYSLDIALGDLDGDGNLDALVVNSNFSDPAVNKSNRVWLNETPIQQ